MTTPVSGAPTGRAPVREGKKRADAGTQNGKRVLDASGRARCPRTTCRSRLWVSLRQDPEARARPE